MPDKVYDFNQEKEGGMFWKRLRQTLLKGDIAVWDKYVERQACLDDTFK